MPNRDRPYLVRKREARKAEIAAKMAKTGKTARQVVLDENLAPPAFFVRNQLVLPARYLGLMPYKRKREVLRQFKLWEGEEPQSLLPWYAAFCNALELAHNRGILNEFVKAVTSEFHEWHSSLPPKKRMSDVFEQKYSREKSREDLDRLKNTDTPKVKRKPRTRILEPA